MNHLFRFAIQFSFSIKETENYKNNWHKLLEKKKKKLIFKDCYVNYNEVTNDLISPFTLPTLLNTNF